MTSICRARAWRSERRHCRSARKEAAFTAAFFRAGAGSQVWNRATRFTLILHPGSALRVSNLYRQHRHPHPVPMEDAGRRAGQSGCPGSQASCENRSRAPSPWPGVPTLVHPMGGESCDWRRRPRWPVLRWRQASPWPRRQSNATSTRPGTPTCSAGSTTRGGNSCKSARTKKPQHQHRRRQQGPARDGRGASRDRSHPGCRDRPGHLQAAGQK